MMYRRFGHAFLQWIPLGIAIVAFSLLIYATVQQSIRSGTDDPQIQFVEDISRALARGTPIENIIPPQSPTIDIAKSISPFVTIYDDAVVPVASSGRLNGAFPAPPKGVFEFARTQGQHRISWQPEKGVRQAIIVEHYSGEKSSGFVMVGRSLRDTEERVANLVREIIIGMLLTLFVTLLTSLVFSRKLT